MQFFVSLQVEARQSQQEIASSLTPLVTTDKEEMNGKGGGEHMSEHNFCTIIAANVTILATWCLATIQ